MEWFLEDGRIMSLASLPDNKREEKDLMEEVPSPLKYFDILGALEYFDEEDPIV